MKNRIRETHTGMRRSLSMMLFCLFALMAFSAAPAFAAGPVVTGVSPTAGQTGTVVTITGSGFTGATDVFFGLADVPVTGVSDTSITVDAPSNLPGTVDVLVEGLGGTSTTTPNDQFVYGAPSVTNVSPSSGSVLGGTRVTISGSGFTSDS